MCSLHRICFLPLSCRRAVLQGSLWSQARACAAVLIRNIGFACAKFLKSFSYPLLYSYSCIRDRELRQISFFFRCYCDSPTFFFAETLQHWIEGWIISAWTSVCLLLWNWSADRSPVWVEHYAWCFLFNKYEGFANGDSTDIFSIISSTFPASTLERSSISW